MTGERVNRLLQAETGVVTEVSAVRPGVQELKVKVEGREERAVSYPCLVGEVHTGERVLLNTTAVRAGLGTGGYHFVMKREGGDDKREGGPPGDEFEGHIVKLRYTPLQFRCLSVEEQNSPHRQALESCEGLDGLPVIVAPLHSHLAPAAAGVKALFPEARVVYLMTDTAALPLAFSKLAAQLREAKLVDATITVGQAFGGDYEAVNVYSGMIAARAAAEADAVVVAQGPGNVGTETEWGFGSIAQADQLNAVGVLGGMPIAVLRISFADPRPRHRGVSRQSLVTLGRAALVQAVVGVPQMAPEKLEMVHRQLDDEQITERHEVLVARGEAGLQELARRGVEVESMGRRVDQDPEFFLAAAACGAIAAERLRWERDSKSD